MVDNCACVGFLADPTYLVTPLMIVMQPNGANSYTIPASRHFVIKSGLTPDLQLEYNGTAVDFFSAPIEAIVVPGGIQIRNAGDEEIILTGYLKNND